MLWKKLLRRVSPYEVRLVVTDTHKDGDVDKMPWQWRWPDNECVMGWRRSEGSLFTYRCWAHDARSAWTRAAEAAVEAVTSGEFGRCVERDKAQFYAGLGPAALADWIMKGKP